MNPNQPKITDFIMKSLASEAIQIECISCHANEFVVLLDGEPLDEAFFEGYFCDECEEGT